MHPLVHLWFPPLEMLQEHMTEHVTWVEYSGTQKNPITSVKEQVCESVCTVQKEERGQLNHPPYSILIRRVQFHSYTLSVGPNVTNLV